MKILHLSDAHFGRQDEGPLEALMQSFENLKPDLAVISGDLTQVASHNEFAQARDFLKRLPCPWLAVPGNHDMPGANVLERLFMPYARYKQYITPDLMPVQEFPDAIVAGLNSARPVMPHWNWANGVLSRKQFRHLAKVMAPAAGRWRVAVFHHPIHKMEDSPLSVKVFGGRRALGAITDLKIDLVLTGHVHHASAVTVGEGPRTTFLSASTSLSSRLRGQENGFNFVTLAPQNMAIQIFKYRGGAFAPDFSVERPRN